MNIQIVICRSFVFSIILVFMAHLLACNKRVPVPIDPPTLKRERLLHIKLTSGTEVKVKEPTFEDGFLLGKTPLYDTRPGPDKEIKIPIDEIESIKVERPSLKKTTIALSAVALTFGIFYYFVSCLYL